VLFKTKAFCARFFTQLVTFFVPKSNENDEIEKNLMTVRYMRLDEIRLRLNGQPH